MKTKRKGKFMVLHSNNDYTCRAPTHEVLTAMTDLSSGAFKLLMYYYSKSSGWDFTEEGIAATLGTSTRTVGLLRKELVDKNYFWQIGRAHV